VELHVLNWLATHWALHPQQVTAIGPVYRVDTPQGSYCLKQAKHGHKRMLFHAHVLDRLAATGYTGTPPLLPTVDGALFATTPEGDVTLTPWVGETLDFDVAEHRLRAAAALARFHNATEALDWPPHVPQVTFGGKWTYRFAERLTALDALLAEGGLPNDAFVTVLRADAPLLVELAQSATARLAASAYEQLVTELATRPQVIHGNMKAANCTQLGAEEFLIDFDSFRIDLWVQDLSDLLLAALPHVADGRALLAMVDAYQAVRPLTPAEADVLVALMSFPYPACGVVLKHATGLRSPEKSLRKWQAARSNLVQLCEFLQKWASALVLRVK